MEDDGSLIHPECRGRFKLIEEPRCFKCGRHVSEAESALCPECKDKKHGYVYGFPLYEYNETASNAMIDYKKNGWKSHGDFFAEEMAVRLAGYIKRQKPEVLVPVPITEGRYNERGFNQSEYLADKLGEKLGIPVDSGILIRTGKAVQQKSLSGKERKENRFYGIECACEQVPYRSICLVDDVYTTGGTLNACTEALLAAGPVEVGFMTIFAGHM